MIDYSDCTKEELIKLVEHYADLMIMHDNSSLFRVHESTEEEIYSWLKRDGLKVKYIESEDE